MGSVLETVNHVRLVILTPMETLPSWVECVPEPLPVARSVSRTRSLFSTQGSFTVSSCVNELVNAGFELQGGHRFLLKGRPLAKAVFVFKTALSVDVSRTEEQHLSDLEDLLSGKWFVRADQNGPIGEIKEEHIVVKLQNRQGLGRNVMIPHFSIVDMDSSLPSKEELALST